MEKVNRFRNVGLLCTHFIRNYAYYKVGWDDTGSKAKSDFWITIQNNFLDIAVLEWTKLFGNNKEEYHWRNKNIISDADLFKTKMLECCGITPIEFCECHQVIKKYRDEFVAHLDTVEEMQIPQFKNALKLTKYYYNHILEELKELSDIGNLPENIELYYKSCLKESTESFGVNQHRI